MSEPTFFSNNQNKLNSRIWISEVTMLISRQPHWPQLTSATSLASQWLLFFQRTSWSWWFTFGTILTNSGPFLWNGFFITAQWRVYCSVPCRVWAHEWGETWYISYLWPTLLSSFPAHEHTVGNMKTIYYPFTQTSPNYMLNTFAFFFLLGLNVFKIVFNVSLHFF